MSVSEYSDLMDFDEEEEGGAGGLERREEKRKEHRAAAGGAMKIERKVVEGKGIRDVHYLIKEPEVKRL
jgi:ribosomal protein S11